MPDPIKNKPIVIRPPSTSATDSTQNTNTTTPPVTGPTAWTGPTPTTGDQFNNTISNIKNTVVSTIKGSTTSPFDMIPGRYMAVSLPQLLQGMSATPEGQAGLGKVIDMLKEKLGVTVPPEILAAIKENPSAITNAFVMTPTQLAAGFAGLNAAYKAGKIKNSEPAAPQLPQHFKLADLEKTEVKRPASDLHQIAPGLFQGDLVSDLPDAQAKNNVATAEIFSRLAANASAPADKQFSVDFNGKSFTRVDDFCKALKADGYQVDVHFDERIANFAALKTAVPGSNPVQYLDVPAPVMVKTGIKDAKGNEATVPVAHSEMIISIKSGPNTKGPKLDADIKYYQGTGGTGFFPANVMATPEWCGKSSVIPLTGDKALKAISLAGAFTDLVNTTAKSMDLYADGYGITGVCNDSVAVVEQAVTGHAHEYPLMMQDNVFTAELNKRLSDTDKRDDPLYKTIKTAIKQLPTDTRMTPTTKKRALESIPWAQGREPFQSTVDARTILSGN